MSKDVRLVGKDGTPMRLDRWLQGQFPQLSNPQIQKFLRKGDFRLNGKKAEGKERVQEGDEVAFPSFILKLQPVEKTPEPKELPISPLDLDLLKKMIIWEDEDLLVLNKISGLPTQGGSKITLHLDGLLRAYGKEQKCTYRLTHRLDRETSGLVLVAKTQTMAQHLALAFKEKTTLKVYWAVVLGNLKPGEGTIKAAISKQTGGSMEKMVVDEKYGKHAVTQYRTLKRLREDLTFLELRPLTGRTHQLRVHTSCKGAPILGDGKYGGAEATALSRNLHLHARKISFRDLEGNLMTFQADVPEHMLNTLRKYGVDPDKVES